MKRTELEIELTRLGFIKCPTNCWGEIFWTYKYIKNWVLYYTTYSDDYHVATKLLKENIKNVDTIWVDVLKAKKYSIDQVIPAAKVFIKNFNEFIQEMKINTIQEIS